MKICPRCAARHEAADWTCPGCGWSPPRRGAIYDLMAGGAEAALGFEAHAFAALAAVEDRYFWFAARNALIAWAVRTYFPSAGSLLEVGCGNGQVLRGLRATMPGLRLTASEAFFEGLEIAASRLPGVDLLRADIRSLPFADEFDIVGAFDVLEHVDDDERAARQMAQAAKSGGGVIVTVPQHAWLWTGIDTYSGHQRRYTRRSLSAVLRRAGLTVLRMTSFVSLLLPGLLLSRLLQRGRPVNPGAEYRIPAVVNRAAAAAMTFERGLIAAGIPLPAGGSLLAVASKK